MRLFSGYSKKPFHVNSQIILNYSVLELLLISENVLASVYVIGWTHTSNNECIVQTDLFSHPIGVLLGNNFVDADLICWIPASAVK